MPFRVETEWCRGYLKFYRTPPTHPFRTAETSVWRESIEFRFVIEPGEEQMLRPQIEFRNPGIIMIPKEGRGRWHGYVLFVDDEAIHAQPIYLSESHDRLNLNPT